MQFVSSKSFTFIHRLNLGYLNITLFIPLRIVTLMVDLNAWTDCPSATANVDRFVGGCCAIDLDQSHPVSQHLFKQK
jgi:hypothetical protein